MSDMEFWMLKSSYALVKDERTIPLPLASYDP